MYKAIAFLVVICTCPSAWAQKPLLVDSSLLKKTDSLIKVPANPHLKLSLDEVTDSLRYSFGVPSDSLKEKIESAKRRFTVKIDSLKGTGDLVNVEKYQRRLDSLQRFPQHFMNRLTDTQKKLGNKVESKYKGTADSLASIQSRATSKLDQFKQTGAASAISLPVSQGSDMPAFGNTTLPQTNSVLPSGAVSQSVTNAVPLPGQMPPPFSNSVPPLSGEVQNITQQAQQITTVTKEAGELVNKKGQLGEEVKEIKENGWANAEKMPELMEKEGKNISELQQLERQKAEAEKQLKLEKELLEQYKNEQAIKAEMEAKVKEMATGKMEMLQEKSAVKIKDLKKIKRKFSDVPDIRNLPKRAPNPMKGLHWRERVVPGFTVQTILQTKTWVEIAPQVSYKLNGSWTVGAGWVYRFSMDAGKFTFDDFGVLNGQTLFMQYHAFKGFFLRAELEHAQWIPWSVSGVENKSKDVWIGAAGLGKSFHFSERVKGNVQTLYHYAWQSPDPYRSMIELRFGFDFSLKPRKKEGWKEKLKQLEKANK